MRPIEWLMNKDAQVDTTPLAMTMGWLGPQYNRTLNNQANILNDNIANTLEQGSKDFASIAREGIKAYQEPAQQIAPAINTLTTTFDRSMPQFNRAFDAIEQGLSTYENTNRQLDRLNNTMDQHGGIPVTIPDRTLGLLGAGTLGLVGAGALFRRLLSRGR